MNDSILQNLQAFPGLDKCVDPLQQAFDMLVSIFSQGGKLLVCGNGGSAADSEHIVAELMKGYKHKRPLSSETKALFDSQLGTQAPYYTNLLQQALPAISLVSQTSLLTAFSNDVDAQLMFAQQVIGYGTEKDCLLVLSTSGKSPNILHACNTAMALHMNILAFTGEHGLDLELKQADAVQIKVPHHDTAVIQQYHQVLYHILCERLEAHFFGC